MSWKSSHTGLLGSESERPEFPAARESRQALLEATMAALALVLCADGRVAVPKPHAIEEVLARVDALTGADIRLANNLLNSYSSGIRNQSTRGRNSALNAVAAIGGDAQAARLLIRICRSVSLAHGGLSPQRVTAIEEVSAALQAPSPDGSGDACRKWGGNGRGPCVITIGNEKRNDKLWA